MLSCRNEFNSPMGALAREREIEAAWRQHEPQRARVPPEARRAVTRSRARIAGDAEGIKLALARVALPLVDAWAKRGALDRGRKLLKIKAALSPPWSMMLAARCLFFGSNRAADVWVSHPSFKQDCVLVIGAVGSRLRGSVRWSAFPALEVPDHALARMYQRAPGINATAALYEAVVAFLRADRNVVEAARRQGETLCLPAGSGLLLCSVIAGLDLEDKLRLVARANTFIADDVAGADQRPMAAALDPARTVLAMVASGG